MLIHHDSRDYDVAASEAANRARSIMEKKIADGRASAMRLLEHVHSSVPVDAVAKGAAFSFAASGDERGGITLQLGQGAPMGIHRHARAQIASKAGIPGNYLTDLVTAPEGWKRDLAAEILTKHFQQPTRSAGDDVSKARMLVRAVGGDANREVRAVLSDRYRRLDSRPLVDAFAAECHGLGAVPVEGTVTDTRIALKAFLPMVFEPVAHEVMCLGVEWSNSDFGAGKHALRAFVLRLWCTNNATMEDALSQVHLGQRLADGIDFSRRTYELDTRTSVSALRDTVRSLLSPAKVSELMATIKAADEKQVEWRNVQTLLQKRLLKEELKAAKDAFESNDVINLPAEKSIWRVSNAISWIAGKVEDEDRKLDLQRFAGEIIHGKREAVAADDAA